MPTRSCVSQIMGSDSLNVAEDEKRLRDWKEQQLKVQSDLLKEKKITQEEYAQAVISIEDEMYRKQSDIQGAFVLASIGTFSSLTGSIADMFKETAGESSLAYKIMFLASKESAIAQATISTLVAANKAREMGGAYGEMTASIVMGLGMANVGLIAAQTISGMAHDGIDSIPREGTWLLDKGERVVDARTNADLKNYLQSNKSPNGIALNMPITAGGGVTYEDLTAFAIDIKSWVIQEFNDAMRPGGKLNRR